MNSQQRSRLRDDLFGGLVSAALSIPLAMGYGMFAVSSLGDSYFPYGAPSGLFAACIVGIVCVIFGERTTTVYAPRVTTTFFVRALLYHLVHTDSALLHNGELAGIGHELSGRLRRANRTIYQLES
jgi:MFS superfamily sulfate permease-like transporter